MTNNQLIGLLCGDVVSYFCGWAFKFDKEAKETITDALEKQIPVKPILGQYEDGWDLYITCPVCKTDLGKPSILKKYCRNCGQALDSEVSK